MHVCTSIYVLMVIRWLQQCQESGPVFQLGNMEQHRVFLLSGRKTVSLTNISLTKVVLMPTLGLGAELMFPKIEGSLLIPKQMWGQILPFSKENCLLGRQITVHGTKGHCTRSKANKEVTSFSSIW